MEPRQLSPRKLPGGFLYSAHCCIHLHAALEYFKQRRVAHGSQRVDMPHVHDLPGFFKPAGFDHLFSPHIDAAVQEFTRCTQANREGVPRATF